MSKSNKQLISFWNLIKRHKIVIPIIQRDYAQGRESEGALRKRFLNRLKKALDEAITFSNEGERTTHRLILDFVYGTPTASSAVAPLDGQQRLTTLWLIHWYIAYISGALTEEVKKVLKSFSYATRVSSRDFCDKLCDLAPLEDKSGTVRKHIQEQTWFYSEWNQDPTVSGMLRMLFGDGASSTEDNIMEIFGVEDKVTLEKYWELLTTTTYAPIMFNHTVIGSEEMPLSDDLYIKMNARGKPLTSFENFKAEVIKWVSEHISKEKSIVFASKFDNEWTDIFWKKGLGNKVHNVDEVFYSFINRLYCQYVIMQRRDGNYVADEKNEDYKYFSADDPKSGNLITFESLDRYQGHMEEALATVDTILQKVKNIDSSAFHAPWNDKFNFIPQYVLDSDHQPKKVTNEIYEYTTINQRDRVAFYAICKYFLSPSHDDDEKESLSHWMRFVWNLISDKDSGGADTIRSVSAIQQAVALIDMIENPRRVYGELYEKSSEYRQKLKNNTVLEHRFIEEIEKVIQILHPDCNVMLPSWAKDWEQAIIEAEKFRLFNGSIGVLFHNEDGEIDWSHFELKFKNAKEYFKTPDNPNAISRMVPSLSDEDILFIFNNYYLHYKDDNVSEMLRRHPRCFHKFLMGKANSDSLTHLQTDITSLCKKTLDFWIHPNWVDNKHVLSIYSTKSGYYESNSYFIDTDYIEKRYAFLSKAQANVNDIQLIINKEYSYPYKGLYIDFTCIYKERHYKFRWTGADWIDMYDKDTNLWREGLHSKFNGYDVDYHFNDIPTFWEEIRRCITCYISKRSNS